MKRHYKTLEVKTKQNQTVKIIFDDERQKLFAFVDGNPTPALSLLFEHPSHAVANKYRRMKMSQPYLHTVTYTIECILDTYEMSDKTHADLLIIDDVLNQPVQEVKDYFDAIEKLIREPQNVH